MTDGTTQSSAVVGLSFTTRRNLTPLFTSPVLYYACPAYAHHRWALREPATRPRPSVRLSHASSSKMGNAMPEVVEAAGHLGRSVWPYGHQKWPKQADISFRLYTGDVLMSLWFATRSYYFWFASTVYISHAEDWITPKYTLYNI